MSISVCWQTKRDLAASSAQSLTKLQLGISWLVFLQPKVLQAHVVVGSPLHL